MTTRTLRTNINSRPLPLLNRALFRQLDLPNLLSLSGLVLSFLAAVFAIEGNFYASILCILYIGLIDIFDGFVARRVSRTTEQTALGGPLDSLVDLCSFGFAPVIFGYCYGLRDWFSISVLALYLVSCASRLAYYDSITKHESDGIPQYTGLTVTFAALLFPNFFVFDFFVSTGTMITILQVIYIGMAIAMVSGFRYAKYSAKRQGLPKRYILLPIGAITLTFVYGYAMLAG